MKGMHLLDYWYLMPRAEYKQRKIYYAGYLQNRYILREKYNPTNQSHFFKYKFLLCQITFSIMPMCKLSKAQKT